MTRLPDVRPVTRGFLRREDVEPVLSGLADGWYKSRDLLDRVNVWLEGQGREPATSKEVGEWLHRSKWFQRRKIQGNVAAFYISAKALSGRDWFVETEAAEPNL